MFASADATDAICVQNGPKLKLEGWRPMEEYIEVEAQEEGEEEDEGEVTEEGNEEKLRKREGQMARDEEEDTREKEEQGMDHGWKDYELPFNRGGVTGRSLVGDTAGRTIFQDRHCGW